MVDRPYQGVAVDLHAFLVLLLSPGVVVGLITLAKHRLWLGLVRHIYDQERASGRTVDPVALLETARRGGSARQ